MSELSPKLSLPFLLPAQAQKHVTHNEALSALDFLVQAAVEQVEAQTPPATPAPGSVYALGTAPEGEWAGQGGQLAIWDGAAWLFRAVPVGMRVWDKAGSAFLIWDGSAWILPAAALDQVAGVGIGTVHDATNRLAIRAPASLFTHDGAGHQIKLNKGATGETASILWQSDWTGHAELGLTGHNDLTVKVSDDGSNWSEAMRFDATNGHVTGAAVQASANDATPGRLMRADFGYSPANVVGPVGETAGHPTGAVIERGDSAAGSYTRFADGTQIAWARVQPDVASTAAQSFAFPSDFSGPVAVSAAHLTCTPHEALESGNLRGVAGLAGPDQRWELCLKSGGVSSDPASDAEALMLTATGRWF